jgi:hypothetical protein
MARRTMQEACLIGGALLLLGAFPSTAVGPSDPDSPHVVLPLLGVQAPSEPVALGPSFEARFFAPTVPLRFGPRPGQALYFNERKLGPLRYSTPMRIAQNDVMVHFEAPGGGIALVEIEVEF